MKEDFVPRTLKTRDYPFWHWTCKKAIDAAAQGGRFILSTGDPCGRDTPDENLLAMVHTARTYGRY